MVGKLITFKGKLKFDIISKTSSSEKRRDEKYWYTVLVVTEKQEQLIEIEENMITFWENDFKSDQKSLDFIANLKEGQEVTVHGEIGGRDGSLLKVKEIDNDGDILMI